MMTFPIVASFNSSWSGASFDVTRLSAFKSDSASTVNGTGRDRIVNPIAAVLKRLARSPEAVH
jgi:hypothetical protein